MTSYLPFPLPRRYLCLIFFALQIIYLRAQNCDPDIEPLNSVLGYSERGSLCEGLFTSRISGSINIINVTRGPFYFEWNKNETINIKAAYPIEESLFVRAIPYSLDTYYQMDGRLDHGSSLEWHVGEVLYDLNLNYTKFGLHGYYFNGNGEKIYFPVTIEDGVGQGTVFITLRSSVDLKDIKYRIFIGHDKTNPTEWKPIRSRVRAGRRISIDITNYQGLIFIEITSYEDSDVSTIIHKNFYLDL